MNAAMTRVRPATVVHRGRAITTAASNNAAAIAAKIRTGTRVIELSGWHLRTLGTTDTSVAHADDRLDAITAAAEFLSEASNVNVQGARVAIVAVTPNLIEQLLAGNYAAAFFCERGQQRELFVG